MSYKQIDQVVPVMLIRHAMRIIDILQLEKDKSTDAEKTISFLWKNYHMTFSADEVEKRIKRTPRWSLSAEELLSPNEHICKLLDFQRFLWLDYVIAHADAQRTLEEYICLIQEKLESELEVYPESNVDIDQFEQQIIKFFDNKPQGTLHPIFDYKALLQTTKHYYKDAFNKIQKEFEHIGWSQLGKIYNPFENSSAIQESCIEKSLPKKRICSRTFQDEYTMSYREEPLSADELSHLGLSANKIEEYFALVKKLYSEALLFLQEPRLMKTPEFYKNNVMEYYCELLQFVYKNALIDEDTYLEKSKRANFRKHSIQCFIDVIPVEIYKFWELKGYYEIEPIESYRMRLEEDMAALEDSWYLEVKYDSYEAFVMIDDEPRNSLYSFSEGKSHRMSLPELRSLHKKVSDELLQTETELDELKDVDIYKTTLEKQQIDADKVHNVITTLNALYKKEEWLQTSIEVIDRCINDSEYFVPTCESGEKLYIYKGNISCHQQGHHIESATAILYVKNDREIKINVEYCTECRKFLLNNTLFEKYRKQYGILVGNFYSSSSDSYLFTSSLALESPLHLSGYNVSQADGLTSYERKLILGRIIHNGIMSKWQVSKYLTYFINMNGAKVGNELAVSKWEDDLAFVEKYDMDIQPQVFVSSIAKYKK